MFLSWIHVDSKNFKVIIFLDFTSLLSGIDAITLLSFLNKLLLIVAPVDVRVSFILSTDAIFLTFWRVDWISISSISDSKLSGISGIIE